MASLTHSVITADDAGSQCGVNMVVAVVVEAMTLMLAPLEVVPVMPE
jgi:hypothetical protein